MTANGLPHAFSSSTTNRRPPLSAPFFPRQGYKTFEAESERLRSTACAEPHRWLLLDLGLPMSTVSMSEANEARVVDAVIVLSSRRRRERQSPGTRPRRRRLVTSPSASTSCTPVSAPPAPSRPQESRTPCSRAATHGRSVRRVVTKGNTEVKTHAAGIRPSAHPTSRMPASADPPLLLREVGAVKQTCSIAHLYPGRCVKVEADPERPQPPYFV